MLGIKKEDINDKCLWNIILYPVLIVDVSLSRKIGR